MRAISTSTVVGDRQLAEIGEAAQHVDVVGVVGRAPVLGRVAEQPDVGEPRPPARVRRPPTSTSSSRSKVASSEPTRRPARAPGSVLLEQGPDGREREPPRLQRPDALEPLEVLGAEAHGSARCARRSGAGPRAGSSGSCRPRSRPAGPTRRSASRSRSHAFSAALRLPPGENLGEFDKDYSGVDTLNVHTSKVGST